MGKTKIITKRVAVVKKLSVEGATVSALNSTVPTDTFIISDKNDLRQALEHYEEFIKHHDPLITLNETNLNGSAQAYPDVLDEAKRHYQCRLDAVLLLMKTFMTANFETVHQQDPADQTYTLEPKEDRSDTAKILKDRLLDFESMLLEHIKKCTDQLAEPQLSSTLKALLSQQSLDFFIQYYEKTPWKHLLNRAGSGLKSRLLMLCDQSAQHDANIDRALDSYSTVFDAYRVRSYTADAAEQRAFEHYITLRFFHKLDLDDTRQHQAVLHESMAYLLAFVPGEIMPEDAPSLTLAEQVNQLRAAFINLVLMLAAFMVGALGTHLFWHQDWFLSSPHANEPCQLMDLNDTPCQGFNPVPTFGYATSAEMAPLQDVSTDLKPYF
jgi:hypothetical protein